MKTKLAIYCVMCGKDTHVEVEIKLDGTVDADEAIRRKGWITQRNGKDFDVYCSKRCAK